MFYDDDLIHFLIYFFVYEYVRVARFHKPRSRVHDPDTFSERREFVLSHSLECNLETHLL